MNRCAYQQTALEGCVGVAEIRRGDIYVSDGVVCPKPIRPSTSLQITNYQPEAYDLKAGTELLDIILTKGRYDMETPNFDMAASPPFFFGSPPSRTSNPLIQDSEFSNNNFVPLLAIPEGPAAPSPPPSFTSNSARKSGGGCVPAAVRIEGFNCCSSISAVA
ncbi:uncharacterized protein LOC132055520 [Lycium ferocissimum]|uniref:uncharacterized protein LOC132055520 n=1 Tax=Lycium ferocissimum TaxID=112874 RepID=UPI002814F120|nr:uncharacterized protein LOC132055520 [Lycium ferocissimum]